MNSVIKTSRHAAESNWQVPHTCEKAAAVWCGSCSAATTETWSVGWETHLPMSNAMGATLGMFGGFG